MVTDRLYLLDSVELLRDQLNDLHVSEKITTDLFQKKDQLRPLIRAINRADRTICSIRKRVQWVGLYIPKDIDTFPLSKHNVFEGYQIKAVTQGAVAKSHPNVIETFIHEKPWLQIRSIRSENIYVYASHPDRDSVTNETTIPRMEFNSFNGALTGSKALHYDTDSRILRLNTAFSSDVFLVFEAQMLPAKIDTRQIEINSLTEAYNDAMLSKWDLMTPDIFEELLLDTALKYLVPSATDPVVPEQIEALTRNMETGNGPTVFVPSGQYNGFGGSGW